MNQAYEPSPEALRQAALLPTEPPEHSPFETTTDAQRWADAFMRIHGGKVIDGAVPLGTRSIVDRQDMIGWFSNAIERGRTEGQPRYGSFPERVATELRKAREAHGPVHSLHEGYAVILEELTEFWRQVRRWHSQGHKRDTDSAKALKELVQTAAMCQRTAEDRGLLDAET